MVFNTIHLFYEKLRKEVKIPIIDLREAEIKSLIKAAFSFNKGFDKMKQRGIGRVLPENIRSDNFGL